MQTVRRRKNIAGVFWQAGEKKAQNLSIYLNKDGYASTDRAFSFVSSSGVSDDYKGYSYTMKLTDIGI